MIRRALATSLLVSLVRTAGADHCQPRAVLDGDSALVARVAVELSRLGVATDSAGAGACPVARVAVAIDSDGLIVVGVHEGSGSEHRSVSDAAVAAMWIDSWLRDELDGAEPAAAELPAPASTSVAHVDVSASVAPVRHTSLLDRGALSVAYEEAWSGSGGAWSGVDASACVRVGPLCVGARARYASTTVINEDTAAARSDVAALATASYALHLGRVAVVPEVGLGVGSMTTERINGCPPVSGPVCAQPSQAMNASFVGDGLDDTTWTPRAEGALRIAVPLYDHVWLDGIAAVTASAFAHTSSFLPGLVPAQLTTADVTLPGEPVALFELGIGLRVGAP